MLEKMNPARALLLALAALLGACNAIAGLDGLSFDREAAGGSGGSAPAGSGGSGGSPTPSTTSTQAGPGGFGGSSTSAGGQGGSTCETPTELGCLARATQAKEADDKAPSAQSALAVAVEPPGADSPGLVFVGGVFEETVAPTGSKDSLTGGSGTDGFVFVSRPEGVEFSLHVAGGGNERVTGLATASGMLYAAGTFDDEATLLPGLGSLMLDASSAQGEPPSNPKGDVFVAALSSDASLRTATVEAPSTQAPPKVAASPGGLVIASTFGHPGNAQDPEIYFTFHAPDSKHSVLPIFCGSGCGSDAYVAWLPPNLAAGSDALPVLFVGGEGDQEVFDVDALGDGTSRRALVAVRATQQLSVQAPGESGLGNPVSGPADGAVLFWRGVGGDAMRADVASPGDDAVLAVALDPSAEGMAKGRFALAGFVGEEAAVGGFTIPDMDGTSLTLFVAVGSFTEDSLQIEAVATFGGMDTPTDGSFSIAFDPSGTELWIAGHLRGTLEASTSHTLQAPTAFALRMRADLSGPLGEFVGAQGQQIRGLALAPGPHARRAALAGEYHSGKGPFGLPENPAAEPDGFLAEFDF